MRTATSKMPDLTKIFEKALKISRYAKRVADSQPNPIDPSSFASPFPAALMRIQLSEANSHTQLNHDLRVLRKNVMINLIVRDLGGLADLAEVMTTTSTLAEITITHAIASVNAQLSQQYGVPIGEESGAPQELIVIGMGKLGGRELNVSSDVDLVFVYPEEGETRGSRSITNHEYFTLLGRKLISCLNDATEDGFVFRVDMRLRPYGESSPLVSSFAMLENYFVTQGREWERYAWSKARVICGAEQQQIDQIVQPFVFRRHLDYSAFDSLRDLHSQIAREVQRREMTNNIKLGPGGIREIEFIVQLFQLVRGGKDMALRVQSTLSALQLVQDRGLLMLSATTELRQAYSFLRNLEHRLQYLDDQQTQSLPQSDADRELIALSMGFSDYLQLIAALDVHRANVTHHFSEIFTTRDKARDLNNDLWEQTIDQEKAMQHLIQSGYREPQATFARLRALHQSNRYRQMPASSQARLDKLVPLAVHVAKSFSNPDDTLHRVLAMLEEIARRESYLALLIEYPRALEILSKLASASHWASEYLKQHPSLLDELLNPQLLYSEPNWTEQKKLLSADLSSARDDTEIQMNVLRHFKHAQTLHLLAQDLAGQLRLERLSDHLSDLAGLLLEQVLSSCWNGLSNRHCDKPRFAIIGYGKLGGKELGYVSDLDLIFLYEDDDPHAPETYARLAQRINAWLTSYTPAGILYETDLRLRPNGAAGLLVSSLDTFSEYQQSHAWVWEHQALTRARYIVGDANIGAKFERIRLELLCTTRDLTYLKKQILEMRKKMLDSHPNVTGVFDIKHGHGGIIDVEFIVQFLILGYAQAHPDLTQNIGNLALLSLAAKLNLVPEQQALAAHDAYRQFRLMQHAQRLQGESYSRVAYQKIAPYAETVRTLWQTVFAEDYLNSKITKA